MARLLTLALWAGLAFLYVPIVVVMIYSFNASPRGTVWGGFSTHWYGELLRDEQILNAAWISLEIAVLSATVATVLGIMAGFALARFGRFRGRGLLFGLVSAPLVLPEVIIGISLLLLFISLEQALGWPADRGALTITIAHATFCSAFVIVVLQPRLAALDRDLENASRDLGAGPLTTFFLITLPLLAPTILSAWLLAFVISFDDLVIASFNAGPESTTLPMLVFSKVQIAISPEINALATLILVAASVLVILATIIVSPRREPPP